MARLYANENFPLPVVETLRSLGHDVLTIQETGRGGQAISDEAVLSFAVGAKRAVLTLNRKHFIQLHGRRPRHFGIIACSFDADFEKQGRRIHDAIGSESLENRLIRVNRP